MYNVVYTWWMNIKSIPCLLTLCCALFLNGSIIYADTLKDALTPQLSNEQVQVRAYQHQDGAVISEYRSHGHVWMIKVQPAGDFPAYYLYDRSGDGHFERRTAGNEQVSPPMWIISQF